MQADRFRADAPSQLSLAIWRLLTARRYRKEPVAFTQSYENEAMNRLRRHIEAEMPVRLNISLFPCKIRHPLRTFAQLGSEIDIGEMASLLRLYEICAAVKSLYPVGAELFVICDGTRYQPCFGDPPSAVADYQNSVRSMVEAMGVARTVKIVDEAPHLPPAFRQLVEREMEVLASEYWVRTSDTRRDVNRLAPTIFLNLDMPPGTSLKSALCAFLALRDRNPDGDLRHDKIGEELGGRILKASLMFVATNMVLSRLPPHEWIAPGSLKLTVHPKASQIGIHTINASCSIFAHCGHGSIRRNAPLSIEQIRTDYAANIMRQPSGRPAKAFLIDPSQHAFAPKTPFAYERPDDD